MLDVACWSCRGLYVFIVGGHGVGVVVYVLLCGDCFAFVCGVECVYRVLCVY